jgi:enamine deaminase RidA (YjgF/YER057c/UK114 family)
MRRETIDTPDCAPTPPFFAQAVKVGPMIFVSGQLARDAGGDVVGKGDMAAQTRQVIANLRAILRAGGAELRHVVKLTAFMTDMSLAPLAWAVRQEAFGDRPPASTGVEVSRLTHPDFLIEMEAIAVIDDTVGGGNDPA